MHRVSRLVEFGVPHPSVWNILVLATRADQSETPSDSRDIKRNFAVDSKCACRSLGPCGPSPFVVSSFRVTAAAAIVVRTRINLSLQVLSSSVAFFRENFCLIRSILDEKG
mmetsp:Transcript_8531/g.22417  ORF Transcript_8531/g.22417 Transcript_8531/m.22417 type:complete len:111 (+) Transcript_8531:206-538(+)